MQLANVKLSMSCDAISATVDAPLEKLVFRLNKALGTTAIPARPLPGMAYEHAAALVNPTTLLPRAIVMSGSHHTKPHVYAIGTESYDAPALYEAVSTYFAGRWSPSRIDAALDLWHPAAFDAVVPEFISYATSRSVKLNHMGDWTRGRTRTLYVGAPTSRVLIRVYEFRQHHGHGADCRVEMQLRPKSSQKEATASRSIPDLLWASEAIRTVLTNLGVDVPPAGPLSPGTRAPTDLDRKLNWLATQALPSLLAILVAEGGDPVGLLDAIIRRRDELAQQRKLCRDAALWHTSPEVTLRDSPTWPT